MWVMEEALGNWGARDSPFGLTDVQQDMNKEASSSSVCSWEEMETPQGWMDGAPHSSEGMH